MNVLKNGLSKAPKPLGDDFSFAYLGSGDFVARWFEWLELYVLFARPVTDAEFAQIQSTLPAAMWDGLKREGADLLHASTGESGVEVVTRHYSRSPNDPSDDEDCNSRYANAALSKLAQFNDDMRAWLQRAHAICPIRLAFRLTSQVDTTNRDAWHQASLARATDFMAAFSPTQNPNLPRGFLLDRILEELERSGVFDHRFDTWKNPLWRAAQGFFVDVRKVAQAAVLDLQAPFAVQALAQFFKRASQDTQSAKHLGEAAYRLMSKGQFAASLEIFDGLVQLSTVDDYSLNNALYAVADDNSKLGVQEARARRFLDAAAGRGPHNPAIFYTGACLWYELGEREKTFEWIALALQHGYDKPQKIFEEGVFAPLRGLDEFESLFTTLQK